MVGATGGELVRLTGTDLSWARPSWSPDGDILAAIVTDERSAARHSQIAVVGLADQTPTILTETLDRNCAPFGASREPVWADGAVWFTIEDSGNVCLYRVEPVAGAEPKCVVGGDRVITGFDAAGGTVAFAASTPTAPAELFVLAEDGGDGDRQLTTVGTDFCQRIELVAPQRFTASSTGGAEVEALIRGARNGDFDNLIN